ncbi:MAG TPA: nucleotidyl transferase AbiEii/AbiGii toxin family protein [Thermoanaerobaculia bacterium]|nr:nucleotidyl transferase AbiEii/AbiGii toxin family protein [Thermoanaerobaculia bacterium]
MTRTVTNVAASVRQRLLNEAKRRGASFDYIASLYARERFLARLSVSTHRARLILKGATVFALWLDAHRPTRDLDFLGSGNFAPDHATVVIRDIISVVIENDGLKFDAGSVTAELIREPDEYHGVRVRLEATLDTARIRLQIDIGLGDVVTPPARSATLPSILDDFSKARVKVYPPETIVSEKLHAMVKLGIANSRMKDFFDVYALASGLEFEEGLLATAIARTFERRKTAIPEEPFALTPEFYSDRGKQTQWRAFLTKSGVVAPQAFSEVGDVLRTFLSLVLASARNGLTRKHRWRGGAWRNVH